MFAKKGQGTTEYLIILSVIIVIALVVVGVMGWFPGLGTTITEQQSRAFWQASSPVAITSWNIDGNNADLVLRNQTTDEITVTAISLDGTSMGISSTTLTAGSQATVTGTGVTCTPAGTPYSYDVRITHNVSGGLIGAIQTGTKPLVGTCS